MLYFSFYKKAHQSRIGLVGLGLLLLVGCMPSTSQSENEAASAYRTDGNKAGQNTEKVCMAKNDWEIVSEIICKQAPSKEDLDRLCSCLKQGIDLPKTYKDDGRLLQIAVAHAHPELVSLGIAMGMNLTIPNQDGKTLQDIARDKLTDPSLKEEDKKALEEIIRMLQKAEEALPRHTCF